MFAFSHQPSDESSATSGNTIRAIIELVPQIKNMPEEQKEKIIESLQPIVRKIAHLSIYIIGGILIGLFCNEFIGESEKKIIYGIVTGFVYAVSDEIHQIFIPRKSLYAN